MKFLLLYLLLSLFISCAESPMEKHVREGKTLAQSQCSTCHQFPEPTLLDKKTWVYHVLPKMGSFVGFRHFEGTSYFENGRDTGKLKLNDWNKIVSYYVQSAPDTLRQNISLPVIDTSLKLFTPRHSSFNITPALTSYVGIFPQEEQVIFADGFTGKYYRLEDLKLVDSFALRTGISQLEKIDNSLVGLAMGVMHPSDVREGALKRFAPAPEFLILDSLQRPIHASFADLNNDSLKDIIVCEFGNNTGQLSWFEQQSNNKYKKHILRPLPGAVKTEVRDFDHNGTPDIMALMAQSDEGMFIFYNDGSGNFREQRILRFSPAFGSNYFELADINGDGHEDIVATNGDNGDYPAILKPYHGIRIYLNDGKNRFTEKLFLPVNGVCKTIAYDFDADGDSDLASIAYFPDFEHRPYESFIYWENQGDLTFKPYSLGAATKGRWLVMDAGDVDNDGDVDIVLGHAKMAMGAVPGDVMKRWKEGSPSVVLLENEGRR